jgi:glyoxylase-like metal-dependent hydrolase (beta-lactamase superfamily II)
MTQQVPAEWYNVRHVADGISHIYERYVGDWLRCNIWHVRGRDRDILIDSGMGMRPLKAEIAALADRPVTAISSHAHFDHIGGAHEFDEHLGHKSEAEIYENPTRPATCAIGAWIRTETITALPHENYRIEDFALTPAPLTGYLDEGDIVDLGDRAFAVYHLPGHSPGSIALFEQATGILLSGDVIYDAALIDDAYHSDPQVYEASLRRLRELPVSVIHPGHGTSFGRDKMRDIIDEYLAGGRRLGDAEAYILKALESRS